MLLTRETGKGIAQPPSTSHVKALKFNVLKAETGQITSFHVGSSRDLMVKYFGRSIELICNR
jgi:hypothetical protein